MNKEERKAIEYYQNKEVSLSVDFDTEKLLKALGITEEDSFENHQIRFKTLLNLIEKLQKENKKLKNQVQRQINSWNNDIKANYISKHKIKDKIKELEKKHVYQGNGYYCSGAILVLQELIEEREEN